MDIKFKIDSAICQTKHEKLEFRFPFSFTFLFRSSIQLTRIAVACKRSPFQCSVTASGTTSPISLPLEITKKDNNNREYFLTFECPLSTIISGKSEIDIILYFDYNSESEIRSHYSLSISKNEKGEIIVESISKFGKFSTYSGLFLFALSIGAIFIWNFENTDINEQPSFLNSSVVYSFLAIILFFLGIELNTIKIRISKFPYAFNFVKNIEFYLEPLFLDFLRKPLIITILALLLSVVTYLSYRYWPLELPKTDIFSFYSNRQKLDQSKIYRKDASRILVSLNDKYLYDIDNAVRLGEISEDYSNWFKSNLQTYEFRSYRNCNLVNRKEFKSGSTFETINPNSILKKHDSYDDSLIFLRISGKLNQIDFNEKERYFCINKGIPDSGRISTEVDVIELLSNIADFQEASRDIEDELWKEFDYEKLHNSYLVDMCNYVNEYFGKKRASEFDLFCCYDTVVNYVRTGDHAKPFFDEKPQYTFNSLLQLIAIFEGGKNYLGNIDFEKVSGDFVEYINRPKLKKIGLNALSPKILVLYISFLSELNRIKGQFSSVLLDRLDEIIETSKTHELTLSGQGRENEKLQRFLLIRNVFLLSAKDSVPMDQKLQAFFEKNKDAITYDQNFPEKVNSTEVLASYSDFLNNLTLKMKK